MSLYLFLPRIYASGVNIYNLFFQIKFPPAKPYTQSTLNFVKQGGSTKAGLKVYGEASIF